MKGWYKHNESIGIIFNEISANIQSFQTDQQHTLNKVWGKPHRVSRPGPL